MITAVVGAGGKTSLIHHLTTKYLAQGKKVFVTTSTHMRREDNTIVTDDATVLIDELQKKGYVMAGILCESKEKVESGQESFHNQKIGPLSYETYLKVCEVADEVLIEADGARQMAVKFPREFEPVIYENVEKIQVVCGIHGLGKKLKQVAFYLPGVLQCLQTNEDDILNPIMVQKLVQKGYLEPLREKYPDKKISIQPSHNNSLYQRAMSSLLKEEKDATLLKEEWFQNSPCIFICGGGHVARKVAEFCCSLDYRVKVFDDREEFANRTYFPNVEEILIDDFSNLRDYLEPDAFYVIVTRGHGADKQCVETILNSSYRYLGMIGSKRKVAVTFDRLRNEGFSEEQIATIHAPIGLPIGGITPGEIAVSIMAQIIQEKSVYAFSSASKELLANTEAGVLCIIIEKSHSTPRNVGSMMLVTAEKTVDSVGGGAIEHQVILDARETKEVCIREYSLTNEEGSQLGMECGGYNKILFIPV